MSKKKPKTSPSRIVENRKARHDYIIEDTFQAGIVLQGWEVKSLRANRAQLRDAYAILQNGEAWLVGAHISPLLSASTHVSPEATRTRKLLLHSSELNKLIGAVERKGYSLIALNMHWSRGRAKVDLGLGKGKKMHDKRATEKDRDWKLDRQRLLKTTR